MHVGVVGINYKLADLQLRELLAKVCQKRFGAGVSTHGERAFVLLSTCNRTEIYFSSEDLPTTHTYILNILRQEVDLEFDQKLYSYFGHACFLHLARVTAGLDSAIVAETEIQGQVKSAYENVIEYNHLPSDLHYLFQKALKVGKMVRSQLLTGRGMPDLEHAILNTGIHMFKQPQNANILFVGASEINHKILSFFKAKDIHNITLCNRSEKHAKALSEQFNVSYLDWSNVAEWHRYDWIIFGTKSPEFILTKNSVPTHPFGHKLVMDLCVPRNVDPVLGRHPSITLLNIDQVNRMLKIREQQMNHTLARAETLISTESRRQIDLFQHKEANRLRILAIGA